MARSIGNEYEEEITMVDEVVNMRTIPSSTINEDTGLAADLGLEVASKNASEAISVVLTDPTILDCPICVNPLCSIIYQCQNGHIACSNCCIDAIMKCPCNSPTTFLRCLAMEKLTESLKVECKNKRFGCKETLIYHKKLEHERRCPNTTCFCPLSSCNFSDSYKNLYLHFSNHHTSVATSFTFDNIFLLSVKINQKHIILQEHDDGEIFILNHDTQDHGRVFSIDCIGPSTFKDAFVYKLTVKSMETYLSMESVPEVCVKWKQHTPHGNCLNIPSGFLDFLIQVCIKKVV